MEHTILKGSTVEEKLACAETALRQLGRRTGIQKIQAPLTPIIISGYHEVVETGGYIFRGIIPVAGTVVRVYMYINQMTGPASPQRNPIELTVISVNNKGRSTSQMYNSKSLDVSVIGNFKIEAGDLISVSVNQAIEGVSYGIVIEPDVVIFKTVDSSDLDTLAPVELAMIES